MSQPEECVGAFDASRACFEEALGWLGGSHASGLTHADLEDQLDRRGRELLRRMCQDHLSSRAATESRLDPVRDADALTHSAVEAGHRRPLATIFGEVNVERLAYRHRGHPNLYPADAVLNLPAERHSHGLRRLAAVEASRGSFEEASDAVERATGQHVAKRQVEVLAARAAADVEEFYATRARP
ncbi:MAG: ISKra4 family transposase, partial [Actinomycetota bacterium]|nr:ISKra4 family transposase [Actinomycetota bacterium]